MATTIGNCKIALRAEVVETKSLDLATMKLQHLIDTTLQLVNGTTDGTQADRVWSDQRSVANGVPDDLDLIGTALTAADGTSISFVDVAAIVIQHVSGAGDLQVGAQGSNPFVGMWGASGDYIIVPTNGGLFVWLAPNGKSPVAGTGDIFRVASSSGTIVYNIIIVGRSA